MSAPVVTVRADTPLKSVARILSDSGISGVPVLDDGGTALGVVSEKDVLFKAPPDDRGRGRLFAVVVPSIRRRLEKATASTAGEAMSFPPVTVSADAPAVDAAAVMLDRGVDRVLVTEDGRLVGIVTRADLVRAFARADEEIAESVSAIANEFWAAPDALVIEVSEGEVTIEGELDSEENATLLAQRVREVPGVVAVTSRLTWRSEDGDFSELPL